MPSIITTSEYKTYAGITGSSYDTVLGELIDNAEAKVERYCDRTFAQATFTETIDGSGNELLQLRNYPVTDPVTSVEFRTGVSSWTTVDSTGYYLKATIGQLVQSSGVPVWSGGTLGIRAAWPEGHENVRVIYEGGYADGDMPDDLKFGLYKLVDWYFAERRMNPALASEAIGQFSISRPGFESLPLLMDFYFSKLRRGDLL